VRSLHFALKKWRSGFPACLHTQVIGLVSAEIPPLINK
jgi:hypothetical protein